jgi:hypothetical protein
VWYPLETVLEFYLAQIQQGRIIATTLPQVKERNYHPKRFEPWEFVPYNDGMLEENLQAWDLLVGAIEARMLLTPSEAEDGLVEESVLNLPQSFA